MDVAMFGTGSARISRVFERRGNATILPVQEDGSGLGKVTCSDLASGAVIIRYKSLFTGDCSYSCGEAFR